MPSCTFCTVRDLDDIDRRLIAALRVDGREPVNALAKKLQVSRATVRSRLDRLLDDGVILGFTARVHEGHDGHDVRAITLLEVQGMDTRSVISALRGFPQIQALHSTNGGWDLVAEIRTESLRDFDQVLAEIRSINGVRNSETSILLSSVLR